MYPRPFVRAIFIFLGDRRPFDTSVYNSGLYRLRKKSGSGEIAALSG